MHIPSISNVAALNKSQIQTISLLSRQLYLFLHINRMQPKLHNLLMLTHSLGLSKDLLRLGERVSLSASGGGGTKR